MNDMVYLAKCDSYDESVVRESLNELFKENNLLDFLKPGLKVGIKLNLVAAMKPEKAATIHPVLIKKFCDILVSHGCFVTLGDSPGGLFTEGALKSVYNQCGLNSLVSDNVKLNFDTTQEVHDIDGYVVKHLDYTHWLSEQDVIINICKLKSHGMMGLSCAAKNFFGCIPGMLKPEYHYRYPEHNDFADMIIDINDFVKPVLNICDAVVCMEGNGPTMGTPRKMGLIMASKNQYAIDFLACQLIDLDYKMVRTVTESIRLGKISDKIEDIQTNIDYKPFIISDFKKIKPNKDMGFYVFKGPFKFLNNIIRKILQVKPQVVKKECIGCKKCFNICPAKAITMVDNKPSIDRDKCIRCFCCQEFCPVGAMKTKKLGIIKRLQK